MPADSWTLTSARTPVPVPPDFTALAEGLDVDDENITLLVRVTGPRTDELLREFRAAAETWADGPAQRGEPGPAQPIGPAVRWLGAEMLTAERTWRTWRTRQSGGTGTDWEARFLFPREALPEELDEVVVKLCGSTEVVHTWRRN